jgi:(R,R)-butanediol dehydrogenase / meso-butanediol dehydrogenase / diacetyl reductase
LKAALLTGKRKIVIDEVPVPSISEDEVLVQVKYCGICGGDLHRYSDWHPTPAGGYLGHEFSGILTAVGKKVQGWKAGERVVVNPMSICGECYACRKGHQSQCKHDMERVIGVKDNPGAFANYVKVSLPQMRLYHLPEEVSFEEGALVEPLSVGFHAVKLSDFVVGNDVMVLGAGPIGLSTILALKFGGPGVMIATELRGNRAAVAKKFGADHVFNPHETPNLKEKVFELTHGKGVDIVFDCTGNPEAFLSASGFLRRGGKVMVVGIIEQELPIVPFDLTRDEIQLRGSQVYDYDDFRVVIELLRKGIIPAKEMITSKIKLSNIAKDGMDAILNRDDQIKILVEPD